ncbi:MAG: cadherin domain-containing protein, partial [Pirellulales bacterium]
DVDEFDVGMVTDTNASSNTVNENAANGTTVGITASASDNDATTNGITYTLTNDAGGRFAVDLNTGVVTVADGSLLNREANASHSITVRATSADGSYTDQNFTIGINDVDEFDVGTVTDTNATANAVNENASVGTVVGITASASDADSTTNTITYTLFDNDGGRFAIDANTGVVTVAGAINRETDGASRTITVRATSADGSYTDQNFTIGINDVDEFDVGSVSDSDNTVNAVQENAANGTMVGLTVSAIDLDALQNTVSYRLLDDAGGRFAIDANTGVVTVLNGSLLNFEAQSTHQIQVEAQSQDGSTSTQIFTIALQDVQERPTGSSEQYSTNFVETLSVGGSGVLLNDIDPDGNLLQAILITGPAHGTLILNADGSFVFTPEAGYTGQVAFTYRATDGQLQSSDILVTIEIVMPPVPPPSSGSDNGGGSSGSSSSGDSGSGSSSESGSGNTSSPSNSSNESSGSSAGTLAPVGIEENQSKQNTASTTQETAAVQVAASTLDTPQEASILASVNSGLNIHLQTNANTILLGDSDNRDIDSSRRTLSSSGSESLLEWSDVRRTELLEQTSALPIQGVVVQTVLGTGVVIWVVQGIQLLATLLSATPAWIQFDPLNVIAGGTNTKEDEEDDASQAIHLFDNKKN